MVKTNYIGRTDFHWRCRGKDFLDFELDLGDLDCLYGNNPTQLNDDLVGKINSVATRYFQKRKFSAKRKKNRNKGWWNNDIEVARKMRKMELMN